MTANRSTKSPPAPRSTVIGAVPAVSAAGVLVQMERVQGCQEMLTHFDPLAEAVPETCPDLAAKIAGLRRDVVDVLDAARDKASTQAWAQLLATTGIRRGNLVALQYRHQGELLDAEAVVKEERLEVQTLAVAGSTAADFYFELHGARLLKNGQPGKTAVTVRVYPGLTATVLAEQAADKSPA